MLQEDLLLKSKKLKREIIDLLVEYQKETGLTVSNISVPTIKDESGLHNFITVILSLEDLQ